jgi:excinuclease ABC subunit B
MKRAIDETEHRRAKQIAFNAANGITSKGVNKEIKRLEKLMVDHAKNLEFEKAAQVRDQLHVLKQQAFGAPGADNVVSILGK